MFVVGLALNQMLWKSSQYVARTSLLGDSRYGSGNALIIFLYLLTLRA